VALVEGLSAMTINAHSTEVGSCTFDEQRRVLEIAQEEIGAKLPLINGVWADSSIEAARLALVKIEYTEIMRIREALIEAGLLDKNARHGA